MTTDPQTAEEFPLPPALHVRQRRRGMIFLCAASAGVGLAMAMQMGMNSNFVVDEMGLSGFQQGILEMARESCGIFALGVLALLSGLAEPLVAAGMLLLTAVGLAAYAAVPDYAWLVVASLVWSQGLHVWMPLPKSMALALSEPGREGRAVGRVRAAAAMGAGAGLLGGYIAGKLGMHIRPLFLLAGAAALLAGAFCLGIPRRIRTPGPRMVLRRKYWLYYLLSFLEGWRKQIFVAFAGFLLVVRYGTRLETMLLLWMAIQALGWLASPLVGRLIDRVGERPVLVLYFLCLTGFFAAYALVDNRAVLYTLYVVDSAFFVFAMALTTYVSRIAPRSEHTATLSMGVAFNHVAAVIMPLVGGILWRHAGHRWVFLAGAAVALLSLIPSLMVPARAKANPAPTPSQPQG